MSPDCGIVAVPFSCLPCRFVPLLGPPHLVISCCLLGLPMPSTLCRLSSPASRHHLVLSSRHLVRHLWQFACVLLCVPPCVPFLATPLVSLLVSLFVSPLVSFSPGDVIAVLPDRPPSCRSALRLSLAPPCLSIGWEQDGTGLPLSLSSARLAAAACSGMAWGCVCSDCGVLPACSTGDRFVSVL